MPNAKLKKAFANDPEMMRVFEQRDIQAAIKQLIEGPQGEGVTVLRGKTPKKGVDYMTPEETQAIIKQATPKKGVDYFTPQELSAFADEVRQAVSAEIEDVRKFTPAKLALIREAVTPRKGRDYFDGKQGPMGEGAPGKPGKDGSPDKPMDIVQKLNTLKGVLDPAVLKDVDILFDTFLEKVKTKKLIDRADIRNMPLNMGDQRWHGGGLSKVTHDATLTGEGTSSSPLSVVGSGGSFLVLAATGTIDDSNTAFTFLQLPTVIVMNGGMYQQTGGIITWTWDAGTLTATLSSPVGTGGSIFGIV